MSLTTKLIAGAGGALMAFAVGGGIASAEPNVEAAVNSPCNYGQVIRALDAQNPAASQQLQSNGAAVFWLQSFAAAPPGSDQRRQMAASVASYPEFASYSGLINSVATSCVNY